MEKNNDDASLDIPLWKRYAFTIEEAAVFYHIGQAKLRSIVEYEQMLILLYITEIGY